MKIWEVMKITLVGLLIVVIAIGGITLLVGEGKVSKQVDEYEQRIADLEQILGQEVVNLEEQVENGQAASEEELGDQYIVVKNPKHNQTLSNEPVIFTGMVSPNTKKVVVNALVLSNQGKTYNAIYTIKDFRLGDTEFEYTSKLDWKNLTVGTNNYKFTAFFEDGSQKSTSVTIYYEEEKGE